MSESLFIFNNAVNHMMRAFLGGKALRKKGITDPNYVDPETLDHGHRGE